MIKYLYGAGLVISLLIPWVWGSNYSTIMNMMVIGAYLASAWNILGGLAGQLSLGHSLFLGTGAYVSSVLSVYYGYNPWIGMAVGGIAAAIIGILIGLLAFRYGLRGPYFALGTLAFSLGALTLVLNFEFVGAASGFKIPLKPSSFLNFQFISPVSYYYIILGMLVLILLITHLIQNHQVGYYFMAIRDNEELAEGLGINIVRYKLLAIFLSAFFTGIAGTFYAQYYLYIDPRDIMGLDMSIQIVLFCIVGGMGTLLGPALGSVALHLFGELLRTIIGAEFGGGQIAVYGLILMLIIIFMPQGIVGFFSKRLRKR